jgi:hypothetical protein
MKFHKILFVVSVIVLLLSSSEVVLAGDFDWMRDFNIRAETNLSEFRVRLGARFKIGDTEINAVLSNVETPANAYMVCRLGEMSGKPTSYVVDQYRYGKSKGWGTIAKSLGIKPGSKKFHALKQGNDFYDDNDKGKGKTKEKSRGKGKNK